jgi:hypothetical protein
MLSSWSGSISLPEAELSARKTGMSGESAKKVKAGAAPVSVSMGGRRCGLGKLVAVFGDEGAALRRRALPGAGGGTQCQPPVRQRAQPADLPENRWGRMGRTLTTVLCKDFVALLLALAACLRSWTGQLREKYLHVKQPERLRLMICLTSLQPESILRTAAGTQADLEVSSIVQKLVWARPRGLWALPRLAPAAAARVSSGLLGTLLGTPGLCSTRWPYQCRKRVLCHQRRDEQIGRPSRCQVLCPLLLDAALPDTSARRPVLARSRERQFSAVVPARCHWAALVYRHRIEPRQGIVSQIVRLECMHPACNDADPASNPPTSLSRSYTRY